MVIDINNTDNSIAFGGNANDWSDAAIFDWKVVAKDLVFIVDTDLENAVKAIGWEDCVG